MSDIIDREFLKILNENQEIEDEKVYSPREILSKLYNIISNVKELKNIWVEGEIVNFKKNLQSGHIYFSLKQEEYVLDCTYFTNNQIINSHIITELQNGKKILAYGSVYVYKKNGRCQLNIEKISLKIDIGEFFKKIKELYEKLNKEGLFDPSRKKNLPYVPINLGIATSYSGAAIKDIIEVSKKRFPDINIYIVPCYVQGEKAKYSIINAINILNKPEYKIDIIIVGRGGGSFDDLLVFSEEEVVRSFANSRVPIVSAVGHKIDRPLCEFAADKIAITPTEAASLCIPEINSVYQKIENYIKKIENIIKKDLNIQKEKFLYIINKRIWQKPYLLFNDYYQKLDENETKLDKLILRILKDQFNRLRYLEEKLKQLNPTLPLEKGFAYITNINNEIIKNIDTLQEKETITIHFKNGKAIASIQKIIKKS